MIKLKPRELAIANSLVYKHIKLRDIMSHEAIKKSARLGRHNVPSWFNKLIRFILDELDPNAEFNTWYYGGDVNDRAYFRKDVDLLKDKVLYSRYKNRSIAFKTLEPMESCLKKIKTHEKYLISLFVNYVELDEGIVRLSRVGSSFCNFISYPQDRRLASSLLGSKSTVSSDM